MSPIVDPLLGVKFNYDLDQRCPKQTPADNSFSKSVLCPRSLNAIARGLDPSGLLQLIKVDWNTEAQSAGGLNLTLMHTLAARNHGAANGRRPAHLIPSERNGL